MYEVDIPTEGKIKAMISPKILHTRHDSDSICQRLQASLELQIGRCTDRWMD